MAAPRSSAATTVTQVPPMTAASSTRAYEDTSTGADREGGGGFATVMELLPGGSGGEDGGSGGEDGGSSGEDGGGGSKGGGGGGQAPTAAPSPTGGGEGVPLARLASRAKKASRAWRMPGMTAMSPCPRLCAVYDSQRTWHEDRARHGACFGHPALGR